MGDANSGGPVGKGHEHIEVGEARADAVVAPVQAAPQGHGAGPVPVIAAADLALVALLQELLASQQAIAARLKTSTTVKRNPSSSSTERRSRRTSLSRQPFNLQAAPTAWYPRRKTQYSRLRAPQA